ncbi:MAG: hypothetical protein H0T78_00315, partial [Longispora sp.]|nr:hypothetical protein [Longispora sp. (in: high G+C Gram-positive bacteria)]
MRRLLTAVVTLGALTVGLLGVTAPAQAAGEKRGASSQEANPNPGNPALPNPGDPNWLGALVPELQQEIFQYLPERSLGQLAQVDKNLPPQVAARHENLCPDAKGVVYAHTPDQLDRALKQQDPKNTKLGIAHALTEAQQTDITAALDAGTLT